MVKSKTQARRRRLILASALLSCIPLLVAFAESENDPGLGLPPIPASSEHTATPAKIALGRSIFFDKRLSADGSINCASCHQPEKAFSDGRSLAKGIRGLTGTRNTPTIINAVFNTSQFWDGRRPSLETQAIDPFLNAREHGLVNQSVLLNLLRDNPGYRKAFREAFQISPDMIRIEHVGQAIASFERTLVAGNSPFDRYYFKGEKSSLSPSAVRGLALYQGTAKCASCHTIGKTEALFTDNEFHSLSVGLKKIESRLPALTTRLVQMRESGTDLNQTILSNEDIAELGRFAVTLKPTDIGKFRTPSLRNVALTAPYMHDGSVATLENAVELEVYYRGAEAGHPLILTPVEKEDLVEFLRSLTSTATTASGVGMAKR